MAKTHHINSSQKYPTGHAKLIHESPDLNLKIDAFPGVLAAVDAMPAGRRSWYSRFEILRACRDRGVLPSGVEHSLLLYAGAGWIQFRRAQKNDVCVLKDCNFGLLPVAVQLEYLGDFFKLVNNQQLEERLRKDQRKREKAALGRRTSGGDDQLSRLSEKLRKKAIQKDADCEWKFAKGLILAEAKKQADNLYYGSNQMVKTDLDTATGALCDCFLCLASHYKENSRSVRFDLLKAFKKIAERPTPVTLEPLATKAFGQLMCFRQEQKKADWEKMIRHMYETRELADNVFLAAQNIVDLLKFRDENHKVREHFRARLPKNSGPARSVQSLLKKMFFDEQAPGRGRPLKNAGLDSKVADLKRSGLKEKDIAKQLKFGLPDIRAASRRLRKRKSRNRHNGR